MDLVVAIDFDLDVIASIIRSEVFSLGKEASRVLCINDDTSVNSLAKFSTSVFRNSPKVFLEPSFVGVGSRGTIDPSSDAPTVCGILAWDGVCGCVDSMMNSRFEPPLDIDGSNEWKVYEVRGDLADPVDSLALRFCVSVEWPFLTRVSVSRSTNGKDRVICAHRSPLSGARSWLTLRVASARTRFIAPVKAL